MSINRLGNLVESIRLDSEYKPYDDIRRFVVAKFEEIKRDHHLAKRLNSEWPTEAHIHAIVDKSSGQFIYAATAMRFIQYSSAIPALSLRRILGTRPVADHSPFAQLDAVYSFVFKNTRDMPTVQTILSIYLMHQTMPPNLWNNELRFGHYLEIMGYTADEVSSYFADLVAIIQVDISPLQLVFHHASLSDYLLDRSRSGVYHVDVTYAAAKLLWRGLAPWKSDAPFTLMPHLQGWQSLARILEALTFLILRILPRPALFVVPKTWHGAMIMVQWMVQKIFIGSVCVISVMILLIIYLIYLHFVFQPPDYGWPPNIYH